MYENELVADRMEVYWHNDRFGIHEDYLTTLYYDQEQNVMMDTNDQPVFNIYDYITPAQFMLFKKTKWSDIIIGIGDKLVELLYNKEDISIYDEEEE